MITDRWPWVPALAALGRDDTQCAAAFSSIVRYFRPFGADAQYQRSARPVDV